MDVSVLRVTQGIVAIFDVRGTDDKSNGDGKDDQQLSAETSWSHQEA